MLVNVWLCGRIIFKHFIHSLFGVCGVFAEGDIQEGAAVV